MEELELARELADIADEISMRHFSQSLETSIKADGTIVTTADREVEGALRKRIGEVFPWHSILGEESGYVGDPSAPTWVIDPIDGTNNYARAIPIFATLIALRVDGRSVLGVASAPALGERYEAAQGGGARMNGSAIHVSNVARIEEAQVCCSSFKGMAKAGLGDRWVGLAARSKRERGFGDFWGHVLVARGAVDVMVEPALAIWDVAALEVIVQEAGGRVTGFRGDPYPNSRMTSPDGDGSCLTTNGLLHEIVVSALSLGG